MSEHFSAERMTVEFVNQLHKMRAVPHVRRVAPWLGLLALGIEKIKDKWWVHRTRQMFFEHRGRRFKVKFNHRIRPRGGIEIVEVKPAPGSPEMGRILAFANLKDAEQFYKRPRLP
jgi:hypothetical protein